MSGADLSGAYLSGADLSGADLSGADLSGADLSKTRVEKARFRANLGISESMKQDLIKQGAIFEDSPGDRSEVLTKV
nr:pentapeptide repeat-containing protein [Microcoleus asticus]